MISLEQIQQRLERMYAAMLAVVLAGLTFIGGFVAFAVQVHDADAQAQRTFNLYAARAQSYARIASADEVRAIAAGAEHPGWTFSLATSDTRYVVDWHGNVRSEPRRTVAPLPFPSSLIEALALAIGAHDPPRAIIGGNELRLTTTGTTDAIAFRTLAVMLGVMALAVVLSIRVARRIARETLEPLFALEKVLLRVAETGLPAGELPDMSGEAFGRLVDAYNRAVIASKRAIAERDTAETRTRQFIADAGHQFRTPLTVLSGFVGILRKGQLRHPDDAPKILEKMEQQIVIIRELVERMMLLETWETYEHNDPQVTDVADLVRGVVDPIHHAHPDRRFVLNFAQDACALVDRSEITHAVTNIIANAFKYAPGAPVHVSVAADEGNVTVTVVDEGPGIAEDELPHVFDRFYRGKRRDVPGSGLGLAIAQVAVERAGGTLVAGNEPGKGAKFVITLPRCNHAELH